MSSGPGRQVSARDIQVVQNLIERCLQLYMNQREVAQTLLTQAKIEPGFTELVWQKLEEENQEFFKAYYLRLMLKYQIVNFNKLLKQHVQLMDQMNSVGAPSMSNSNGSHNASMHQNPVCCTSEDLHHPFDSLMTNAFANGIHTHQSMLSAQSSDMQGLDGGHFADASFSSVQFDSQSLNGGLQIPRCFNFFDSTADFAPSSDVLESYRRSTFLTSDNDFLDFQGRESQGDNKRLDTKSEGAGYDDFGSK